MHSSYFIDFAKFLGGFTSGNTETNPNHNPHHKCSRIPKMSKDNEYNTFKLTIKLNWVTRRQENITGANGFLKTWCPTVQYAGGDNTSNTCQSYGVNAAKQQ